MKRKKLYYPILILFVRIINKIFGFDLMCNILLFTTKPSINHNKLIIQEFGGQVGTDSFIFSPLLIHNANGSFKNLKIGNKCHIGKDVLMDLTDKIIIQDSAVIAMRTTLLTHLDVAESPLSKSGYQKQTGSVVIGSGAYIGAGATILHGLTIGEGAIIGAGAVVIENIPPYSVAVGVPAKVIKKISSI